MTVFRKAAVTMAVVILLVGPLLLFYFFAVATIGVVDATMEPNLSAGAKVIVNRLAFVRAKPERGDVIAIKTDRKDSPYVIRRVIGVPNDTVRLEKDTLIINGEAVPRQEFRSESIPYSFSILRTCRQAITVRETIEGRVFDHLELFVDKSMIGPVDATTRAFEVPADSVFVLGDNRDTAIDSRQLPQIDGLGFVNANAIAGKVVLAVTTKYFGL